MVLYTPFEHTARSFLNRQNYEQMNGKILNDLIKNKELLNTKPNIKIGDRNALNQLNLIKKQDSQINFRFI